MTAQIGDILYYEGNKYFMASEPPLNPSAAVKYDIRFIWQNTACWRGYQAEWEVKDKQLFIKSVKGKAEVTDKKKFRQIKLELRKLLRKGVISPAENDHLLKEGHKDLSVKQEVDLIFLYGTNQPVFASWFSGTIRIPRGKMLEYVHMDYFSVFEENLCLTFKNGILVKARVKKTPPGQINKPPALNKPFLTDNNDDYKITPN